MLELICYFFPAFISLNIHTKIMNENRIKKEIYYYGIYVALINLFTLSFVYIRHHDIFTFEMISVLYCFKYLLIATIIAIIIPFIIKIIIKYIDIDVEVQKNEKKNQ